MNVKIPLPFLIILVAISYVGMGALGKLFALPPGLVCPVWPAAGLALAAVVLIGRQIWPGVFLGSLAGNLITLWKPGLAPPEFAALGACTVIAAGAVLEAFAGAWLMRRWGALDPQDALRSVRGVLALLALGAVLATTVNAVLGPVVLAGAGILAWPHVFRDMLTWWCGDAIGVAVMTPLMLAWWGEREPFGGRTWIQVGAYLAVAALATAAVFGAPPRSPVTYFPYLVLVWLIGGAVAFSSMRVSTLTLAIVGGIVLGATSRGDGPFQVAPGELSLLYMDLFAAVMISSTLILAAVIDERATAAREVKERDQLFGAFMARLPAGAFLKDRAGRYVFVNDYINKALGFRSDMWVGKTDLDVLPPGSAENCMRGDLRVLTSGEPDQSVERAPATDGTLRDWLVFKFLVRHNGQPHVGGAVSDVTELLKIQRELADANRRLIEADRYKDEFLGVVSHELRTPINQILGYADILADQLDGPLTVAQLERLAQIQDGAVRLNELIEDLLAFASMQTRRIELDLGPSEIEPVIAFAIEPLRAAAARKRIQLAVEAPPEVSAPMDAQLVALALRKLVANAIKFSAPDGVVSVSAAPGEDEVTFKVVDSGPGISQDDLGQLFERFHQVDMSSTRPTSGLGLGLALAKAIVEAHHGHIGVLSDVGRGSTFWFAIPVRQADRVEPPCSPSSKGS